MDSPDNPFAQLLSSSDVSKSGKNLADSDEGSNTNVENVTKTLESILLITHDKSNILGGDGRPSCLLFVPSDSGSHYLRPEELDQVIFDRAQMPSVPEGSIVYFKGGHRSGCSDVSTTEPMKYLTSTFVRAVRLKNQYCTPLIIEECKQTIVRQLLLFLSIDVEIDSTQNAVCFFNILREAVSGDDLDYLACIEQLFHRVITQFESDSIADVPRTSPCPSASLKPIKPLVDQLAHEFRQINPDSQSPSTLFSSLFAHRPVLGEKDRALFCSERKPLIQLSLWFTRYFVTSQLFLEASFPTDWRSRSPKGYEFEVGPLGRLLIPSHLHALQSPELAFLANRSDRRVVGEFFTDEVLLKPVVEAEQRTISQLTEQLDDELHTLMLNFLRVGKQRPYIRHLFFCWIGSCITANKARGQLGYSLSHGHMPGPETKELASDGFLNNLAAAVVRLTGPLVSVPTNGPPLDKIWPSYAIDSNSDEQVLPELCKETRLVAPSSRNDHVGPVTNSSERPEYPMLTELFFLAHSAIRIGWTPIIATHFETAQQLHQLETQWQAHEASALSVDSDPQAQFLRRIIRERTSRYLEQSTSLSFISRLRDQLSFAVTTSQLLVKLAHSAFDDTSKVDAALGQLSDLPEFLIDNIVELISYLRRAKDDFLESPEVAHIPLEPLMNLSILFMLHTNVLTNPHLRARLAEVLESLIPLRDDEAWNSQRQAGTNLLSVQNLPFVRRQLLMAPDLSEKRDPILHHAVAALLTAFVSIELSPGTGAVGSAGSAAEVLIASTSRESTTSNVDGAQSSASEQSAVDAQTASVGFEEKFQYRRPMYACLRYWYGNPLYDNQFLHLESEALIHIDDATPPLFLQFLSLLVNDAIFLLDEAINLLAQLKQKELERESLGGRLRSQEEESLFIHSGRLARHHVILGLDTIAALGRVVSICSRLITHPVLVDRIACMLNYFLARLVGPKQRDLTVRDKAAYGFRPDLVVIEICKIYCSLGLERTNVAKEGTDSNERGTSAESAEAFRRAVVCDERSFSSDLLDQAVHVLSRVAAPSELQERFSQTVVHIKNEKVVKQEDDWDFDDAPDDYVDPIMGNIMEDPVKLPTSGHIVDRKTIYRHLLNDSTDPFNRQPLAMAQVEPQEDLKAAIHAWVAERRAEKKQAN
ncbi:unnamed protein product [Calicophoron daubneyi]|uniref:Ubiquitin conjugation factor E4 A n=1 Tax=Calicophoron daubneyi TaxID=300641 RepID=A0AAV2T1T5_CALDB